MNKAEIWIGSEIRRSSQHNLKLTRSIENFRLRNINISQINKVIINESKTEINWIRVRVR